MLRPVKFLACETTIETVLDGVRVITRILIALL